MKSINKISMVVLKFLEVAHWIGSISMIVVFAFSLANASVIRNIVEMSGLEADAALITYGFEVSVIDKLGALNLKAVALFALGSVFIIALMAMVFRNAYLIIKKSKNITPFQKDNIRMVREIGIFSIVIPIIALIMSSIIHFVFNSEIETSVRFDSIVIGIIALALTNVFSYGIELQNDVDGLL